MSYYRLNQTPQRHLKGKILLLVMGAFNVSAITGWVILVLMWMYIIKI